MAIPYPECLLFLIERKKNIFKYSRRVFCGEAWTSRERPKVLNVRRNEDKGAKRKQAIIAQVDYGK